MTDSARLESTDWVALARTISQAPAASIQLIRERGADVRIARATTPDGQNVVVKLWNRPGWRGLLRRLTGGNPARREWRGLQRMHRAGIAVPQALACLTRLGAGAAHTEALITRDLGPCENGVDHLKALIASGDTDGEQAFVEAIVEATRRMVAHGFLDIDHRLPNFIASPDGQPVRLDFELIARRPWPNLWKAEYGHMLGTLIGSFTFAVQPDTARARHFAERLRAALNPPEAVLASAQIRVRAMLEVQHRAIGMKVELDDLWS